MSDSTLRYIQVRRLSTFVSRFRLTAKATRQFIRSSHGQKVFAATKRPNACSYHTNMHIYLVQPCSSLERDGKRNQEQRSPNGL